MRINEETVSAVLLLMLRFQQWRAASLLLLALGKTIVDRQRHRVVLRCLMLQCVLVREPGCRVVDGHHHVTKALYSEKKKVIS